MTDPGKYDSPFKATINGLKDLYRKKDGLVSLPQEIDLTGKTILITGSSSGLGLAAAKRIAKAGANVIMAIRSGIPERGEEVIRYSGNPNVKLFYRDLLDLESIKQFINNLESENIRIDILISNAAMVPLKSRKTKQGLEEMFMVNYLAPFYLINQLINKEILYGTNSRIIIISSESHRNPKGFDWKKFGKFEVYGINGTVSRYGYYKLLLTTFANELSRTIVSEGKQIFVRVLCPGPVNSNIAREAPSWMKPILKATFSIFFKSPEKASDPILYFASEKESTQPIEYLFLLQPKDMDEKATDEKNGEKLWKLSEGLIKKIIF